MIRSIVRAVTLGAVAAAAMVGAQAASATAFTFDFTKNNFEGGSYSFSSCSNASSNCSTGTTLNVKATAWHANDPNQSAVTRDSISTATLGLYSGAGMGVLFGNDTGSNGTHQIDNVGGGEDFVMLQFDKDVTLDGIYKNVYSMQGAGVACCSADAAYWADAGHLLGAPSANASIDLTKLQVDESLFTQVDGGSGASAFNSGKSASVWLVSAAFNQSNDGFKIAGLQATTANPTAAVPEPASWAMMIVGFGAVGSAMRRRKSATLATA